MRIQYMLMLSRALGAATLWAIPASAQCRRADEVGNALLYDVRKYAHATDSLQVLVRDNLELSPPSRTGVGLVTKSATCKSANTAYQKAATGDRATLSGRVYVIQTGSTYVVLDPAYRYTTESNPTRMVFNSSWVLLTIF